MESLLSVIIVIGLVIFTNANKFKKESGRKPGTPPGQTGRKPGALPGPTGRKPGALPGLTGRKPTALSRPTGGSARKLQPEDKKRIPSKLDDTQQERRTIAIRLMEGDPVPQGFNAYVCAYCGAVNLVKKGARGKHCCYFCHDPID